MVVVRGYRESLEQSIRVIVNNKQIGRQTVSEQDGRTGMMLLSIYLSIYQGPKRPEKWGTHR